MISPSVEQRTTCFHCGENCGSKPIIAHDKNFCCEGCRMVFEILQKNDLCDYYQFSKNPGASRKISIRKDKYAFLDDKKIIASLVSYADDEQSHITFYLPQIHCSSCLWLLENLHRLNENVISAKVNFSRKEANIIFRHNKISLRQVAELLTEVGYEPYISFNDMKREKPRLNRSKLYKLGVAGFCFANIMLFSFPEYLGIDVKERGMLGTFRIINLLLSLPVFFYSASEFYISAWKSLKHKFLNIDAPIVLAVWVTFGRSLYEVFTSTGSGYFDSMTGIVFFMLVGRVLQDKTYEQLNFDRDYTAYFPIAVSRLKNGKEETVSLPDIQLDDTLLIHNAEIIPADGILTRGNALIDYSFVTGESLPVKKEMGEIVYAGGRQTSGNIEMLVIKEVSQSYLTRLWNNTDVMEQKQTAQKSFVHLVSRYFTWIVFTIATLAALYWFYHDPTKIWPSVTAVLIIACPCALLLANSFTNGHILRIASANQLYLRNAQTIEQMALARHIVFDKTGTLTNGGASHVEFVGRPLSLRESRQVLSVTSQSSHALSKAIAASLAGVEPQQVTGFNEIAGAGIEGFVDGELVRIGSKKFVTGKGGSDEETCVYVAIDDVVNGKFLLRNNYRDDVFKLFGQLKRKYRLSILSGDNAGEQRYLHAMLGSDVDMRFGQMPFDKLETIKTLQRQGKVVMVGDGLNDAGALQQADVGIAISDDGNNFTPASDAILKAEKLPLLYKLIQLCRGNKQIVIASFVISILYNIIGIFFAVQGNLEPVIAAILMPASSISIIAISYGCSKLVAWRLGLSQ